MSYAACMLVATMALMAPMLQGVMGYPIIDCRHAAGDARLGMWSR